MQLLSENALEREVNDRRVGKNPFCRVAGHGPFTRIEEHHGLLRDLCACQERSQRENRAEQNHAGSRTGTMDSVEGACHRHEAYSVKPQPLLLVSVLGATLHSFYTIQCSGCGHRVRT